MKLSYPIHVRLHPRTVASLTAEAEAKGVPLATLIRERVEKADAIESQLIGLRTDLALLPAQIARALSETDPSVSHIEGMLGEVLQGIRALSASQAQRALPEPKSKASAGWPVRR